MNAASKIIADTPASLGWAALKAAFEAARAAELAHDAEHILSIVVSEGIGPERNAQCDSVPDTVWNESERLGDIRCDAEEALFHCPAPSLADVIWKVRYARERWKDFVGWPPAWTASALTDLTRLAAPTSHEKWLRERDDLLRAVNTDHGMEEAEAEAICLTADAIEDQMLATPSNVAMGVLAKCLLFVADISVEASRATPALADAIFEEARGLGLIEYAA